MGKGQQFGRESSVASLSEKSPLPFGDTFVANKDKVVDKPRHSTFTWGSKKMYKSPVAATAEGGASPAVGDSSPSAASPLYTRASGDMNTPQRLSPNIRGASPTGKKIMRFPLPNSPNARGPADGPVPHGAETTMRKEFGGARHHSPSPVSKHAEDSPTGKKCLSRPPSPSVECKGTVYRGKNDSVAADGGKKTSIARNTDNGEKKYFSVEQLHKSQRYEYSAQRLAETTQNEQPAHRPVIHLSEGRHNQPSLLGVMKAAPPKPPKAKVEPSPWEKTSASDSRGPTPTRRSIDPSPWERPSNEHARSQRHHSASPSRVAGVLPSGPENAAPRATGRRTPQRAQSPGGLVTPWAEHY